MGKDLDYVSVTIKVKSNFIKLPPGIEEFPAVK